MRRSARRTSAGRPSASRTAPGSSACAWVIRTTAAITATSSASAKSTTNRLSVPARKLLDQARCTSFGRRADDVDEDDQRDAVADAALGDLLAEPHDEDRAGGLGDHHRQDEAEARVGTIGDAAADARCSAGTARRRSDWISAISTVP